MSTIYDQFINSSLDLSALGLENGDSVRDGAVPANSRVLARVIDSPVFFCQILDRDSSVYAIDSTAFPGEQILPVAKDIPEFIGLLIRCRNATLIAKAYQWSSIRFRELLDSINPSIKAQSVIRALENTYHPPIIHDPAAMLLQLRQQFRAAIPEQEVDWKVGFSTEFSKACSNGKAGKELVLNKAISREEGIWHVPAIYLCGDGIVADTFLEVSAQQLTAFNSNWGSRSGETLSLVDKLQQQLDDPLTAAVTGSLTVNDKPLRCKKSYTAIWNPLADNDNTVRRVLNHYKLNPDCGYLFRRYCFPRKGKQPQIRTMQLTLEAVPVMVPEESFCAQQAGMKLRFRHPSTGLEHIFTVQSVSQEALNPNFLSNHPCFYTRLSYALEPSISPENFWIVDQTPSDWWEDYQEDPAAVIYGDRKPDPGRYALSSLHYEPQEQVRWQMIFRRKLHKDLHLQLIP